MTKPTDVFFDTNIIVYFVSNETEKIPISAELLKTGGFVSVQVLNEFASAARRKLRMPWPDIRLVLDSVRRTCDVVPLTLATHQHGLEISERYRLNVYDGVILAAAEEAGCSTVYSEDMQDGLTIGAMRIVNPFGSLAT